MVLSGGRLIEKGYNVAFFAQSCSVPTKDSFKILKAQYDRGIYKVNLNYGQPTKPLLLQICQPKLFPIQIRQLHTTITKPLPMQTYYR